MNKKVSFKTCFHVEQVEPDLTFLLSEKQNKLLRGRLYFLLAPFLQEPLYSMQEIVEKLIEHAPAEYWNYALLRLDKLGYLEHRSSNVSLETSSLCNALGISSDVAQEYLNTTKICLSGLTKDHSALERYLQDFNVILTECPSDADLNVLIVDDYLQEGIEEYNRALLEKQKPWILFKPSGNEIWMGPYFCAKETGCWKCLAHRLRRNRPEEVFIARKKQKETIAPLNIPQHPSFTNAAYQLIAIEVLKHVFLKDCPPLFGKIITFDVLSSRTQEHILTKRPQCSCCETLTQSGGHVNEPLVLTSRKKSAYQDGGSRIVSAEETINKYLHHVSPITGIIESLEAATHKNLSSIHGYIAWHNINDSNSNVFPNNPRSGSGGKGRSILQAKASALCEALERYSAIYEGIEICRRATYKEIAREAIHPESCLLYSKRQYELREQLNPSSHSFHKIPVVFCEDISIDWTPVWSFTEKKHKYVPTAFCFFAYPSSNSKFCQGDSNGNASGNCLEEAILHGLFELVERDSAAIWWYNRLQRPRVNLESFNDSFFKQLLLDYEKIGREVWVIDITSDLNIPVFVALSRKTQGASEEIVFGFGCDLNPRTAISRALTEMNQPLCFYYFEMEKPSFARKEDATDYDIAQDWLKNQTLEKAPYLCGSLPSKSASDYTYFSFDDFYDEILFCQKIIEDAGMEFLVLDQTRPDIALKTVKIVIPGLRHFWPRFAPGRLFDVPVKMGWRQTPLEEEELNPIPIFI